MTVTARAVLRSNRLLRDLPDGALDLLAALAIRRSVGRGARIFAEGDPGDSLLGIVAGQVRISASTPDGREIFLNILEPGDSLGEIAVLDGEPRTATADALTDVELFVIRRPDLLVLISQEPRLAMHLIALLCRRLRWTSELIEEAAFLPAGARLASRLLKLGAEHGRPAGGGITLHISQAELAAFLNVSRQVVNQQLQAWRRQGWVALGRGRVVILDPEGLRSAARGGG
jgi:CRP/FNR family cyclic AMP-dependent transcriptional regulator